MCYFFAHFPSFSVLYSALFIHKAGRIHTYTYTYTYMYTVLESGFVPHVVSSGGPEAEIHVSMYIVVEVMHCVCGPQWEARQ